MSMRNLHIDRSARAILSRYGSETAAAACLMHLTDALMRRVAATHDAEVEPPLDLQQQCVRAWCLANGVDYSKVAEALAGLRNADPPALRQPLQHH